MGHVVVLGAGIGGVPAAYDLRKELSKEHKDFSQQRRKIRTLPVQSWAAVGGQSLRKISLDLTKTSGTKKNRL